MLCLAFDTATTMLTVAVGRPGQVLAATDVEAPRDHMARLAPLIEEVLGLAGGVPLSELDAVVVGVGPGSYTGTRIGVATAKGLARAADLPLFGVPSPDAVAQAATGAAAPIMVVADAARGEVYPMVYEWSSDELRREETFTAAAAEDAAREAAGAADAKEGILLAGDGLAKYLDLFQAVAEGVSVLPESSWYPRAVELIERVGVLAGRQDGDPDTVLPIYARASDAEEGEARRRSAAPGSQSS